MTSEQAFDNYLAAVRSGDRRQAFEAIRSARAAGLDLHTLYMDVFQPALRRIGQLWQENLITVAEEHLATAITQTAMLRLYGEAEMPEGGGPMLIAACAETERHELGLRMLCDFMDLEGWETVFLGSSVPADSLVAMVRDRHPDAVALSATIHPHIPQLRTTISRIREAAGPAQPLILVGGRPFVTQPELAASVGADLTASDAKEAAARLKERLS